MFCKKTQETLVKPEAVKEEVSEPVSVWDRFDAAERERRIDEFITADKEALDAAYRDLPSIADRRSTCPRCGQRKHRQHISTVEPVRVSYEIAVKEEDGELILSKGLDWSMMTSSWGWGSRHAVGPTFTVQSPMYLAVTCECGKSLRYRPLDEED
jgi:hypothetical protein